MKVLSTVLAFIFAIFVLLCPTIQAQETQVISGVIIDQTVGLSIPNHASPFLLGLSLQDYEINSTLLVLYSLRFIQQGVSVYLEVEAIAEVPNEFSFSFKRGMVRATLAEGWSIKFGCFDLNWRNGRIWSPSDVVNAKTTWASHGSAPGRYALELTGLAYSGDIVVGFGAATVFDSTYKSLFDIPIYGSIDTILYPFDLRFKFGIPSGGQPLYGASASWSFGELNLYGDLLLHNGQALSSELGFDTSTSWKTRWCVGGTFDIQFLESTFFKGLSLGTEYLHQDDGLTREEGASYFSSLAAIDISTPEGLAQYVLEASRWNMRFFSLYRDYINASVSFTDIADKGISVAVSAFINLNEGSFAILSSLSWNVAELFTIVFSATNYGGPADGEAAALPELASYSLSLKKRF